MKASDRPIVVATTVPHEKGIKITLPTGKRIIQANIDLVWAMLDRCDGRNTKLSVIDGLERQFPSLPVDTVERAFDQLVRLGVLLDRRMAFKAMLAEMAFPPLQSPGLSPVQVREHVESQRLPVARGEVFQLDHDASGTLARLQAARRSCHSFSPDEDVNSTILAQLLTCTYSIPLHATPSGGRLYPLKMYLILTRTQGQFPAGYYEYDPELHLLVRYNNEPDPEVLKYAFNSDPLLHNAPAIVVIAADLDRQPYKYGNGGFVLTLLEAGHAAQNLLLASAECGLSTLEYKSFRNAAVAAELGLNVGLADDTVWPIISVAIGHQGTDTRMDPQLQLEQLTAALMAPTGPITSLHLASSRGDSDPGFAAAHATATTVGSELQSYGSGSALTEIGALTAAAAEAYERYASGLVRVERIASAEELTALGERWLDPRTITPLRDEQRVHLGLDAFDPFQSWQWVEGTAADGNAVWVPIDLVYYPCPTQQWGRGPYADVSSSGVAAYTNAAEAANRALLELIERHALMANWYAQTPLPKIPTDRLTLHWRRRISHWESLGRRVHVLDMSHHARGLIAVNVVIEADLYPFFMTGAAASTSLEDAVSRAFREAERQLCGLLQGHEAQAIETADVSSCADHGTLYAGSRAETDKLMWLWSGGFTTSTPDTASVTLAQLMTKLGAIVVRLSPPGAYLDVVRVLTPELVPISFGTGYTYDCHPALGDTVDLRSLLYPHYFP